MTGAEDVKNAILDRLAGFYPGDTEKPDLAFLGRGERIAEDLPGVKEATFYYGPPGSSVQKSPSPGYVFLCETDGGRFFVSAAILYNRAGGFEGWAAKIQDW